MIEPLIEELFKPLSREDILKRNAPLIADAIACAHEFLGSSKPLLLTRAVELSDALFNQMFRLAQAHLINMDAYYLFRDARMSDMARAEDAARFIIKKFDND